MYQDKKARLPKCWHCGKRAEVVYENEYWTYTFDKRTGKYTAELVDIDIRCPYCNANLKEEFPEGVCNYSLT
jgi:DNA-directed RNA polymerase subunit RPC12/RpoP